MWLYTRTADKRSSRKPVCSRSHTPTGPGLRAVRWVLGVIQARRALLEGMDPPRALQPRPRALQHSRVLRTLGDEVEAIRRVIRTGREEVGVPELCSSHGDQENPP